MASIIVTDSKRVRASSVLEVIIAMAIILAVFGIAMMIFTNVTNMSLSGKKLRAEAIVKKALLLTDQSTQPDDQSLQIDGFKVDVKIQSRQDISNMMEIDVNAYDENQQQIASVKKLIIHYHD